MKTLFIIALSAVTISASSAQNAAEWFSRGEKEEQKGNSRPALAASRENKKHADRALALDPKSDYAHHMLGRWYPFSV